MSASVADVLDGTQHAGKNLTVAGNLVPRLDDISNSGDARLFAGSRDSESRLRDTRVFEDQSDERSLVDVENFIFVAEAISETNFTDRKFGDLKSHNFLKFK